MLFLSSLRQPLPLIVMTASVLTLTQCNKKLDETTLPIQSADSTLNEKETTNKKKPTNNKKPNSKKSPSAESLYREGLNTRGNEALKYFTSASELGHTRSTWHVGKIYLDGKDGVTKSSVKAAKWLMQAADQGESFALKDLYFLYINDDHSIPQNRELALTYLKKLADSGDFDAKQRLKVETGTRWHVFDIAGSKQEKLTKPIDHKGIRKVEKHFFIYTNRVGSQHISTQYSAKPVRQTWIWSGKEWVYSYTRVFKAAKAIWLLELELKRCDLNYKKAQLDFKIRKTPYKDPTRVKLVAQSAEYKNQLDSMKTEAKHFYKEALTPAQSEMFYSRAQRADDELIKAEQNIKKEEALLKSIKADTALNRDEKTLRSNYHRGIRASHYKARVNLQKALKISKDTNTK